MGNEKKTISRQTGNLILLVAVVLVVAAAGILIQRHLAVQSPGVYAVVQYQGEIYERLDLSVDTELRIEDELGNYNIVCVQDGQVWVSEANCPDLICVYTYPLNETGGAIACLPHELLVYIESEED